MSPTLTPPTAAQNRILSVFSSQASADPVELSSTELAVLTGMSLATLKRQVDVLLAAKQLERSGKARATRYRLAAQSSNPHDDANVSTLMYPLQGGQKPLRVQAPRASWPGGAASSPPWSLASDALRTLLQQSLTSRTPVTYQRRFVDDYQPNASFLLGESLAQALYNEGRMTGQQPAGTYARKVLEQLLIDLSWSSSRLEGNTFSLLATQQLFELGVHDGGRDAVMLLNHKRGIEFMVDAVPHHGLTRPIIANLHALLMQDLLDDVSSLGAVRNKVVHISDTVYIPTQVPSLLDDMLNGVLEKARLVKNPLEAAFFLWLNIAYLQPFEDGNKRTSRLAANVPLMLYNCAPLSFLDVDPHDYAAAMIGVYEQLNLSMAQDLFAWTYRRGVRKYAVILESMGQPDAFRVTVRERLNEAIQAIVREGKTWDEALALGAQALPADADRHRFATLLREELTHLTVNNCARYRLNMGAVEAWVGRGRPIP